jgi:nucleoside-triphosphatase THEP1
VDINSFKKANLTKDGLKKRLVDNTVGKIKLGIKVLDDVFGGLNRNDILLIGAKTGIGKSELVSEIAMTASGEGKSVHVFSLESEEKELEMRIAFKKIALASKEKIFFKKWYNNEYPHLEHLYDLALNEINNSNLYVYYRNNSFGILDFMRNVMLVRDKSNLIIVDHIHYFDFDGKNENKELSDAIKQIRDIALLTGIPIIIVAHLRKEMGQGKFQKLMPEIDDFFGSSDLSKVCTKAIMIGTRGSIDNNISKTFFHFPKFRQFGSVRNYLFACDYNLSTNEYSDNYEVFYFKNNSIEALNNLEKVPKDELKWLG